MPEDDYNLQEIDAETRVVCKRLWDWYVGLRQQGFDNEQTLHLLVNVCVVQEEDDGWEEEEGE